MSHVTPFADSAVSFCNSQGTEAHGVLIRLSRESIAFEIYNPYSIVQMGEVLTDVRIRRGDRLVYTGNASVNMLINTGLMAVVKATLLDAWSDMVYLNAGPELRDEVKQFVEDWAAANQRLRPGYVRAVSSLRHFLQEFSRWLDHGEAVNGLSRPEVPPDRIREFLQTVESTATPQLRELFNQFEEESNRPDTSEISVHTAYARREIHPVTLCSPFVHRSYTKPLGYAGDYEMVNMMFREPWEGPNVCSRLLELFCHWTLPGGLVVATNVHPSNPMRRMMEHVQEWTLVLRDEAHLRGLAPDVGERRVSAEQTGVNVFLEIRKPAEER